MTLLALSGHNLHFGETVRLTTDHPRAAFSAERRHYLEDETDIEELDWLIDEQGYEIRDHDHHEHFCEDQADA